MIATAEVKERSPDLRDQLKMASLFRQVLAEKDKIYAFSDICAATGYIVLESHAGARTLEGPSPNRDRILSLII